MTKSIQEVANSARTAAVVARTASSQRLERRQWITVQSILKLQDTVAEAANKVKRLENLPTNF